MLPEERRLARDDRHAGDRAEDDDPDPRRAEARMEPPQPVGQLAMEAHRVDEPGDADDPGVGGDEQDRRGQQADVDLARVLERAKVQLLDDPQHRVTGVAALGLVDAEQRLVVAVDQVYGQRRQGHGRHRGVDREHGDHDALDRGRDRLGLVLGLLGHVRDRLDPGVGDHPDRNRDRKFFQSGRVPR